MSRALAALAVLMIIAGLGASAASIMVAMSPPIDAEDSAMMGRLTLAYGVAALALVGGGVGVLLAARRP